MFTKNLFVKKIVIFSLLIVMSVGVVVGSSLVNKDVVPSFAEDDVIDRTFKFDESITGKTVLFYGDSITARYLLTVDGKDYMQYMQEELGFSYYSPAIGGATWTYSTANNNNIFLQYDKMDVLNRDVEHVTVFLGVNDWFNNRPLGTINDNPTTQAEATTIYGSMNKVLTDLISVNPDVKIMLFTPLQTFGNGIGNQYATDNAVGVSCLDINNAIKQIAEKYNCSVCDLQSVVTVDNYDVYLDSDKLHVTDAGYRAIADFILNQQ